AGLPRPEPRPAPDTRHYHASTHRQAPNNVTTPAHVVPHPPPRLDAAEPLAHPQQQRLQLAIPQTYFDIALRLHNWFNAPRSGE
ncbi:hypothetical protein ABZV53_44365, partial [Streptomyces sp900116325]